MSLRPLLAVLVGALAVTVLTGASKSASAGSRACGLDVTANGGYAYAGHQSTRRGHGVRATLSTVRTPEVAAGHVAGWVGLGGPGQGPNGSDMWIQVGIASMHGMECMIGCMLETSISVAAAVHVAVAKSDVITKIDLDGPSLAQFNPVDGGVIFNESEISVTDAPGLGICEIRGLERIEN